MTYWHHQNICISKKSSFSLFSRFSHSVHFSFSFLWAKQCSIKKNLKSIFLCLPKSIWTGRFVKILRYIIASRLLLMKNDKNGLLFNVFRLSIFFIYLPQVCCIWIGLDPHVYPKKAVNKLQINRQNCHEFEFTLNYFTMIKNEAKRIIE